MGIANGHPNPQDGTPCSLTLEDEFVLTRIRSEASSINKSKDRDQYFWKTILKFVARERAYKTVLNKCNICVDINVKLFDDQDSEFPDD